MHAGLSSIQAHPSVTLAVVFVVACAESVALIGTLVPAGIVMFAAGTMISLGVLDGWTTLTVGALGAIIGDSLSYELGRRFHADLKSWWVRKGQTAVWARGEQFAQRHGAKSVVFARFLAPVRAIVPLVVGCALMPRRLFYSMNVMSALAWSSAHIVPGIVFGASAALARAVSARLAALLLVVAALLWVVFLAVRIGIRRGIPLLKRTLWLAASALQRRFPHFCEHPWVRRIVDPQTTGFSLPAGLALLFVGSTWLFASVLRAVVTDNPLMKADTAVFTFLESLRTTPADIVMSGFVVLDSFTAGLTVAAAVLVLLAVQRCWRTATWWMIVVGIALVLTPLVGPHSFGTWPLNWQPGSPHTPLPDSRAAFSVLVYGFLGWVMVQRQGPAWRGGVSAVAVLWVVLTGFADLYLGRAWLTGLVEGWSLGVAWLVVLAGIHAHWQLPDEVRPASLVIVVTGVLTAAALWAIPRQLHATQAPYAVVRPTESFSVAQWLDTGWQQLPARRIEISGYEEEPLPLQWAADESTLTQCLTRAGWRQASMWSMRSALGWLLPQSGADALPVLPKYSQGESSRLAFVRIDPQDPASRLVLRLWRAHYAVHDTRGEAPLWYGALYRETLHRPAHLITLAGTTHVSDAATLQSLLGVQGKIVFWPGAAGPVPPQVLLVSCAEAAVSSSGKTFTLNDQRPFG
ncbi:LssY C-terminal domain-containing protein [Paraburkholderia sediminicola]|uniref:LssY C-terminal domain-containing protein n=1 Tax=Paraburkholderia sediminicola TaxID=458836 RepID=UPI0038B803E7